MESPPSVRHLRDEVGQSAGAASAPPRQQSALQTTTVAVVGLGYVGLPLAVEFGKRYRTIGFDLSHEKIANYRKFIDRTGEVNPDELAAATKLSFGTDPAALSEADFIVVAVPT